MITNKQKQKIIELRESGLKIREISEKLGIKFATVHYHLNPEKKKEQARKYWRGLSIQQKKERRARYKDYQIEYQRKKYNSDEDFKEKKKKLSRDYYKRKCQKNHQKK